MTTDYSLEIGGTDVPLTEVAAPLRWSRGQEQVLSFAPPAAGQAEIDVYNLDGHYSLGVTPLNKGQAVKLSVDEGAGAVERWAGVLDTPQYIGPWQVPVVSLGAFGTLSRLADKAGLSTALYQDIRTDEAMAIVLELAGLTAGDYDLDEGQTTLRWWWLDGGDALGALLQLWASEGPTAQLYEGRDGQIVFRNRHAVFTDARSTAVQAFYGTTPQAFSSGFSSGFSIGGRNLPLTEPWSYEDGLQDVVNTAAVTVARREAGIQSVVWEYGGDQDVIEIGANETRTIRARASGDDLILDAITPSADAGDYEARLGSIAAVSIDRTSGPSVQISLTAGSEGATVGGLLLRAKPVSRTSEIEVTNSNHPLAANETPRPYQLEVWPYMNPLLAQDFVNFIVDAYRGGRPQVSFSTVNTDDVALASLLERDIGDRVHVTISTLGIDEDLIVLQRSDELGHGLIHRVTFGCEAIVDIDLFILDTSQFDIDKLSF